MTIPNPTRSMKTVVKITMSGERFMPYLLRLDKSVSTDKAPPPEMRSESAIARSDSGYSNPLLFAKKWGQCIPTIAVTITQPMKNAPTRVNRPSVTNMPPTNSEIAAAASHAEVGRMNVKGVFPEMNVLKPGPPKVPKTFCAPWPIITAPNPSRIGTVAQVGTVEAILRNMLYPSQLKFATILTSGSEKRQSGELG